MSIVRRFTSLPYRCLSKQSPKTWNCYSNVHLNQLQHSILRHQLSLFHTNQMIVPSQVIPQDTSEQRVYKLKSIFETYDLDGNGFIDREELQNMLSKASISSEYAIKMMDESKGKQGISFNAFCKLLQPLNNLDFDSVMKYWLKQVTSVEIPDAEIIVNSVFKRLLEQAKANLKPNEVVNEDLLLQFPREILYLGGAPGAGKGTVTEHILKIREISAPPIVMSSLLDSPQAKKIKDAGGLVGDFEVVEMLFTELLKPQYQNGAVIDGFPRTMVQVEVVKKLYDKMMRQHMMTSKLDVGKYFRRPIFRSLMLFVEEKESVMRQLNRGHQIIEHNKKVQETGNGVLLPLRKTDVDRDAARLRYNIFKEQTYDSLQKLKQYFHYHMINAQGTIEDVKHNIEKELLYQSSLELSAETFATIKHIPTASDVIINARQKLVSRLDDYQRLDTELFQSVAKAIEEEFEDKIEIGAIAGCAYVSSMNPLFDNELARKMALDIMSDRGFTTTCRSLYHTTPVSIGPDNTIICKKQNIYEFNVRFPKSLTMASLGS